MKTKKTLKVTFVGDEKYAKRLDCFSDISRGISNGNKHIVEINLGTGTYDNVREKIENLLSGKSDYETIDKSQDAILDIKAELNANEHETKETLKYCPIYEVLKDVLRTLRTFRFVR